MRHTVRAFIVILMAAISLASLTGNAAFAASKVFTIGYANSGDSDVFDKIKKDTFAKLAAADPSVKVKFSEANMDQQKQLDQIGNFIMQEVDVIVVVPIDYSGVTPGVQAANKAGIPVICLGIESKGGDYIFVGCQNRDAGVMQAEYMAKKLSKNASVLYLSGTPGLYHSIERRDGFYQTIAKLRPDVKILAEMTGEYTRDKAMKVVEDWCQKYNGFEAVVAANDQMALGTIEALRVAKRLEGVMVAGIDATDDALNKIKKKEMSISIRQSAPALAQNCLDTAKKIQAGKKFEKRVIVAFEPITIDNVGKYLK